LAKGDQIVEIGKKTLQIELQTIRDVMENMGDSFRECVESILECKARVLFTGVGKSALIAQKIVATFNSTGSAAVYMHAADAVHGDLGMISKEDVIVCLSKSGETPEIKVLLPILRDFGNKLIGMTSNKESYLAKNADLLLYLPVSVEADPNQLAPTASSIAQMAMGDALASALLYSRGFSHEHFAKFHPGGSIGKQLYLRVDDIYPMNEKPEVNKKSTIRQVIVEMTSKRLGMTVVTDDAKAICGVITDGDLRRMLEKNTDISPLTAGDIMTLAPKTMPPGSMALEAFQMMRNNSITQIIIADDGKYLGIVHIHDLIREGFV
jgi:arabinose-5-phosphate isomerase